MGLSDKKVVEPKPKIPTWKESHFILPDKPYLGQSELLRFADEVPRPLVDEVRRTGDHIFMMLVNQKIDAATLRDRVIKYQNEFKIIGAHLQAHFDLALKTALEEGRVFKDGDLYHLADKYNTKK